MAEMKIMNQCGAQNTTLKSLTQMSQQNMKGQSMSTGAMKEAAESKAYTAVLN